MNKEELLTLISNDSIVVSKLKILLTDMNTADIADILEELDKEKAVQIFRILPKAIAADVFAYIESDYQQLIIEALTDTEISQIVNKLFVDDAVDFIEEMPASVVKRVLQNVKSEKRNLINKLLQYPDDSAGSIMTTEYVDLREDLTVQEAFEQIRKTGINKETIYNCYVIRKDRLLIGVISAKKLMLAQPQEHIGELMDENIVIAHTSDDQETIAAQFQKYGLLAMPVVDKEQRLVGIITVDDIVEVIVEESTEDIEKMSALAPSDEPYLKTSVLRLAKNRILWILVLMFSATITGSIISSFENSLAVLPILMSFIPMLMNTGGISGSQASTLIIRGMAVGEIRMRDVLRVMWREIRVGALCGIVLSSVNMLRVYLMNSKNFLLAATISTSLLFTIIIAKTIGGFLPILAKRLKIDPAIMAAPLITTIVDSVSLMIYFSFAKIFFKL